MKRIDAMIPNLKRRQVVDAVLTAGARGLTVSETRGRGVSPRPLIGGARGTAKYIAEYNRTDTITIIVEDSQVDVIVKAIMGMVQTGTKSDGKIFVSNIEETYDISTGQKGKL